MTELGSFAAARQRIIDPGRSGEAKKLAPGPMPDASALASRSKRRKHVMGVTGELALAEQFAQQKLPRLDVVVTNEQPVQPAASKLPAMVRFIYKELQSILNLYGRQVAQGEWRDYALDFLTDRALFSIYRHHSERPLYVIEKNPKLRERQGQYLVLGQHGMVLKRGQELEAVLRALEPKLSLVK